jgi:glycosyltransferase involved in cell wall biosynthesis
MPSPLDLTIAIPVRNEAQNLPGCIGAIGPDLARHIVVIDSGSTDQTVAVAESLGAEVVNFVWDGKFPKKRNWYLRNHTPTTKWVLFLDADEFMTAEFKAELRTALAQGDEYAGFWLSYTVYFLGKQLKGGYPMRKLALFRVGAGEYERIDEDQWSKLDMEVHEHPVLTGQVGVINQKIDHQDFRGIGHYMNKHNEYANWETARFLQTANSEAAKNWTWKQRLKYRLMQSVFIGPAYFCGSFFLLGGFRDGSRGLAFSLLKAAYFTQIYCRLRELQPAQNAA